MSASTDLNILQCCKKPINKSIDYILDWIANTQIILSTLNDRIKSVLNDEIPPAVDDVIQGYDWSNVEVLAKQDDLIKDFYITIEGSQIDTYTYRINVADTTTNGIIEAINDYNLKAGYKWYKIAYTFGSSVKYGLFSFTYVNASDPANSKLNIVIRFEGREFIVNNVARSDDYVEIETQNSTSTILSTSSVAEGRVLPITSGGVYTALLGKANSTHTHDSIENEDIDARIAVINRYIGNNKLESACIYAKHMIEMRTGEEGNYSYARINNNNISNLYRALSNPDLTPASGSNNLITSGAVYNAFLSHSHQIHDGEETMVYVEEENNGEGTITLAVGGAGETYIDKNNLSNLIRALRAPDTTPALNSDNLVTSDAVYRWATRFLPQSLLEFKYNASELKWYLYNVGQMLEESAFNDPKHFNIKVVVNQEKVFYTFGCINKTLEQQDGYLVVRFYIDGNIFEWSVEVQGQQEAEAYHFDENLEVTKISPIY